MKSALRHPVQSRNITNPLSKERVLNSGVLLQVSKQAKEFLEFVYEEPLLDVQQLNPCLYEHCEPLSTVLRLRQQLQSLRAYLFSCRATVAEDLRRRCVGWHLSLWRVKKVCFVLFFSFIIKNVASKLLC